MPLKETLCGQALHTVASVVKNISGGWDENEDLNLLSVNIGLNHRPGLASGAYSVYYVLP